MSLYYNVLGTHQKQQGTMWSSHYKMVTVMTAFAIWVKNTDYQVMH